VSHLPTSEGPRRDRVTRDPCDEDRHTTFHGSGSSGENFSSAAHRSAEQQGRLMQHRTRDLLMRQRTQVINALRAHLAESQDK
jgi:hypothetical protein